MALIDSYEYTNGHILKSIFKKYEYLDGRALLQHVTQCDTLS